MPRKATGAVYESEGRWYASLTVALKLRRSIPLPTCRDEAAALARCAVLAPIAAKLRAEGIDLALAVDLLGEMGSAKDGPGLADALEVADRVCAQTLGRKPTDKPAKVVTFQIVAQRWTSGELAKSYPDHVKIKSSADRDRQRLDRYVYPHVGPTPIADFALEHAELVMARLPPKKVRTAATRRHIAQLMHRVLGLAVYPLKLRTANPLPRGFMPKVGPGKAKGWLYPDEDTALLACRAVPLAARILYGFLDREGPRASEAAGLRWADVDLERGAVTLDENKTDDPRAWALSPGVVRALAAWRDRRRVAGDDVGPASPVFPGEAGAPLEVHWLADELRDHLRLANVDRAALFEHTATRHQIRAHDLRATFITIALANGRSESWVQDRTGHRSSQMINKYRRAARTAAELELGELLPLDAAIPELAPPKAPDAPKAPAAAPPTSPAETSGGNVGAEGRVQLSAGSDAWIRTMIRGFKETSAGSDESETAKNKGDHDGDGDRSLPLSTTPDASRARSDASLNPRAALVAQLLDAARDAAAAGDLDGARVAHEAAGKLLALPDEGAPVVDLARERAKRGK